MLSNFTSAETDQDLIQEEAPKENKEQKAKVANKIMTIQFKKHEKIDYSNKAANFGKMKARHPDSILAGFPQPVDARFDNIEGEMEFISKFRRTNAAHSFESPIKRDELWGDPIPQQPYTDDRSKTYWKPKSTLPIKKTSPGHLPINPQRFCRADGYLYETLKAGFEATTYL